MGPALVDHVDDLATTFDTVNANALPSQRHRERETDIAQADNHHRGRLLCRHSRYSIFFLLCGLQRPHPQRTGSGNVLSFRGSTDRTSAIESVRLLTSSALWQPRV